MNTKLIEIIERSRDGFIKAASGSGMDFRSEAAFAMKALERNEQLRETAIRNPMSLQTAMENIAAVGLSINPITQLASLIPRDGAVVLDISYEGIIKIATESWAILWARAEPVYEKDRFVWRGPAQLPIHEAEVFEDRGAFRGVYCIAKTPQNDVLVEVMPASEVYKIRDTSRAKNGPWIDWFEEMARKAVIKRASKTWPKVDPRLFKAIQILNHEGLEIPEALPPSQEVSEAVKKFAAKLCYRAAKADAWEEAEEYARNRYEGENLAFVLDQLSRAKAETK